MHAFIALLPFIFSSISSFKFGAWLPVGSVSSMSNTSPNSIKIVNKDWVVWKGEKWNVQRDVCPHRKAPLSQGRIDPQTKCIECPYHGWQFDKSGETTLIPQEKNSCDYGYQVSTLPTYITKDLLWAFFPESICGERLNYNITPDNIYNNIMNGANDLFVRELPYSFDILIENFMDPAHIPFAHHGLQGMRSDGSPIEMKALVSNNSHLEVAFKDKIVGKSRDGVLSYQRPTSYHFRTLRKDNTWKKNLQLYAVPVEEGLCRVFINSPFKKGIFPSWFIHAMSNRFLNTDIWLHNTESNILSEDILSDYNLISADKGVIYWRSWWSKYGQRNSPTGTFGKAQKITKLPRHKLVDTWNSHTRFCKHCKNALKRYKKLKKFSQMGIIVGLFNRWRIFLAFSIATNIIANKIITIITGESIVNVQDRSYSAMKS